MNLIASLKGLFHSAPSVSSPSSEMTERTANLAVPNSFVQSVVKDVCIAVMNNQQAAGSPLTKEELEQMLVQVAQVISTTYQLAISKGAQVKDNTQDEASLEISKPAEKSKAVTSKSKDMMARLMAFLRQRYHFQYNVLTRETEMRDLTAPTAQYVVVTKREENTLVLDAHEAGIDCWNADVNRIIHCSKVDEYHPFIQYFNRLPKWDGTDRVTPLAKRISDNEVWITFGFHRWMLAMVAQWMHHVTAQDRANCVAPLLISEKQRSG
jgi:hypothetical protein